MSIRINTVEECNAYESKRETDAYWRDVAAAEKKKEEDAQVWRLGAYKRFIDKFEESEGLLRK